MKLPAHLPDYASGCLALSLSLVAAGCGDDAVTTSPTNLDGGSADRDPDGPDNDAGADASVDGSTDVSTDPVGDGVLEGATDSLVEDGQDGTSDGPTDGELDVEGDGELDAGDDGTADGNLDANGNDADADDGSATVEQSVCYHGDFDVDGTHEIACVSYPNPMRSVLSPSGLTVAYQITSMAISPDGALTAAAGRANASAPISLQVFPSNGMGAAISLVAAPAPDRTISQVKFSPDGRWVSYVADFDMLDADSLYLVPASGGAPSRLSQPPVAGSHDVVGYAWARSGSAGSWMMAFVGDLDADTIFGLWSVDALQLSPAPNPIVTAAELGPNGDVKADIAWDAQGRILFRSNLPDDLAFRLFMTDSAGTLRRQVPGTNLMNPGGPATVGSFGISPEGDWVALSVDSPTQGLFEVFVLPLDTGASAAQVSNLGALVPTSGTSGPMFQQPISWSPDGSRLAVLADWRLTSSDHDDSFAVFLLPSSAPGGGLRLLGVPTLPDRNIRQSLFSHDSRRIFARGDLVENGAFELYSTADLLTPDQDPTSLRVEEVPSLGDVLGMEIRP